MASTRKRIKQIIDEHLDLGREPDFDAQLANSGLSSIDAITFFKEIDRHFDLSLKARECLQFRTLGELVTFIDSRNA